jgi:CMP-N-acetylneuraminic acid synthetase
MTNVAVSPARGGSKGINRKNLVQLNGKPLIAYTIEAAIGVGIFDRICVSTDDAEIALVSKDFGAEVIERPDELSQDDSSSLDAVCHALEFLDLKDGSFCLLQPTSPLRTREHIKEAFDLFRQTSIGSVISVSVPEHHPYKCLIDLGAGIKPLRSFEDLVSPRQKLPKVYAPNGAIYFCDVSRFLIDKNIFHSDTKYYSMGRVSSIDIDDMSDLDMAVYYLGK